MEQFRQEENLNLFRLGCGIAIAGTLAGCAAPTTQRVSVTARQAADEAQKQMDIVAQEVMAERVRLHNVHWKLVTNSTTLCPKLTHLSGVDVLTLPKGDAGTSYARLFGVQKEPTVVNVFPGSPAEQAGIQRRDVVLSVYGLPLNEQNAGAVRDRSRNAKDGESMPMQLRRGGQTLSVAVKPQVACDYPVTLVPQQVLNAYADGERIYVTRGMMAFARTDEELALVVGHELAHNSMRHIDAKKANAAAGLVADIALAILSKGAYRDPNISNAAAQAYSQEFEAEADYVGLYMLASSGYSIEDAPKFWRRMAAANPGSIKGTHSASHPATSYRMVALEEAAKEISVKRSTSASLVPTRKDGTPFVAGAGLLPGQTDSAPSTCTALMQDGSGRCASR